MADADAFNVIRKNHAALLEVLNVLEKTPGTMPSSEKLRAAIWPALKDYGLRDTHGSVWDGSSPAVPVNKL